jgi:hypothetical protein
MFRLAHVKLHFSQDVAAGVIVGLLSRFETQIYPVP